jgi:hypothetical protein
MFSAYDDDDLVTRYRDVVQYGIVDDTLDKAEFYGAISHRFNHLSGVANVQANIDGGVGAAEGDEMARKPIAGDGLTGLKDQRSSFESSELGKHEFGTGHASQDCPRVGNEERASLR